MKNRLLPSCFLAFFLGISLLLFSSLTFASSPDLLPGTGDDHMNQIRNNQVTGTINPADVLKARAQFDKLMTKSSASLGLNWQALGPDNYSGRSRTVIFDNQDPAYQTLYTGGVTGGLYKSINMGLSWEPVITGSDQVLKVSALVQKPNGTIFIGTGELYCGDGAYMGSGLYRSDDGVNFSQVASAKPVANDPATDWAYILKLAWDANSNRLYAITNKGVRYSENDGGSWVNLKEGSGDDLAVGSNGTLVMSINDSVYVAVGGNLSPPAIVIALPRRVRRPPQVLLSALDASPSRGRSRCRPSRPLSRTRPEPGGRTTLSAPGSPPISRRRASAPSSWSRPFPLKTCTASTTA